MKRVRKIADDFAIEMKILHLPVEMEKLEEIAEKNEWRIISYSKGYNFIKSEGLEKYCYTSKGFTYSSSDCTIIFIKDELEYLDKINVICHEMGHLVLKHIEVGTNQKSITIQNEDRIQEIEADVFALMFQSPTYLMQTLSITNSSILVEKGIFSKENAKKRCKYLFKDIYYNKIKYGLSISTALLILVALLTFLITRNYYINKLEPPVSNVQPIISTAETTTETTSSVKFTEISTEIFSSVINNDEIQEMVYITKSGKKYHKQGCHYITNKETTALSISEAENNGYSACSVCFK